MARQRTWLPSALAVTADPEGWAVAVQEADSADDLLAASCGVAAGGVPAMQPVPPGGSRAVYELTAVVALVRCGWSGEGGCCAADVCSSSMHMHMQAAAPAHARLPHPHPVDRPPPPRATCRDEDEAEEAAEAGQEYEGHLISHIKVPPTYFEAQEQSPASGTPHALSRTPSGNDAGAVAGAGVSGGAAAGAGGGGGSGPTTPRLAGVSAHEIASMLLPGAGAAAAAAAAASAGGSLAGTPGRSQQQQSPQQQQAAAQLSSAGAEAVQHATDALAAALGTPRSTHSTPPFRHARCYSCRLCLLPVLLCAAALPAVLPLPLSVRPWSQPLT